MNIYMIRMRIITYIGYVSTYYLILREKASDSRQLTLNAIQNLRIHYTYI